MKLKNFLVLALLFIVGMVSAQQMPNLPVDAAYRIGKLDNGLTYYIRHNEYPAHVANFYIAQRVGSIQEDDHQRGLAHFLEHMAFNGSSHFKDNGIIEFTRGLGVEFGRDLNAYTSIEETVYNIDNVPTTRQSALDSCLLVLQDWSSGLILAAEEIDKERGVIHGEWAMRNSAQQRLIEKALPAMYPGCKYGERLPIGLMEIVDNFSPEALRQYYRKWYHPENQAIIVIGDIDVDHTEAMIKKLFSDIKPGEDAAHVVPLAVPDNKEAIYIFDKDKEMQYPIASIFMKSDPLPREMMNTPMEYITAYITSIVNSMFNSRMSELSQDPSSPFVNLTLEYGNYLVSSTKEAWECDVVAKEGKEAEAYAAAIRELRRAKEYGFTPSEFSRAKQEFKSRVEKEYSNRDKRKNTQFFRDCLQNYLKGSALTDADTDYQLMTVLPDQLPLAQINQLVKESFTIDSDSNLVSFSFAQEKEGAKYVGVDEMKKIMADVRAEKIEAWVDNTKDEPLIANLPKAGKIKKETKNDKFGTTELLLSNGAKVILKKTDFKDDEVLFDGFAPGGQGQYDAADYSNMKVFDNAMETIGLGNFTNNELEKALAGKQCSLSLGLNSRYNTVSGATVPKDMETMLQLLYLHFTDIKKDEKAYNSYIQQMETMLKNRDLQPETQFSDSITAVANSHNPRYGNLTIADLPKISIDRLIEIAKERFSNANNYTFTIVGNYDESNIRQLICQYIASLPGKEKTVKMKDVTTAFTGKQDCQFTRKMETPKPYVLHCYRAKVENTLENNVLMNYVGEVLSMVLLKTVREDAGATYSVGASAHLNYVTDDNTSALLSIVAPISEPSKVDIALKLFVEGVEQVIKEADADMVAKVKANLLKNADINAKQNAYWQSVISANLIQGLDKYTEYKKIVEGVTPQMVSAMLKKVVDAGNFANIVMRPE